MVHIVGERARNDCRRTVPRTPCIETRMAYAVSRALAEDTRAHAAARQRARRSKRQRMDGTELPGDIAAEALIAAYCSLLRTRYRTSLRLRFCRRRAAADRHRDVRRDNERYRRIGRQLRGRCDWLRPYDRLPRERRGLQHGTALAVADTALRVEYHGLAGCCARRSKRRRYGKNRCQRSCGGHDQDGFEQADRTHGRTG